MAAYKKIQGNPIKPQGGKPGNLSTPHHFRGTVKAVGNVKGGPDLGGRGGKESFMGSYKKPTINTGLANKIVEARGKHLA